MDTLVSARREEGGRDRIWGDDDSAVPTTKKKRERGKKGKRRNTARRKERRGSFKGPRRFCRFGWVIVKLIFSLLLLHILYCDRRMGSAYAQSHTRASVVGGCLSLYRYRAVRRRCRYSGFLLLKLQQGKTFTRRKKNPNIFSSVPSGRKRIRRP